MKVIAGGANFQVFTVFMRKDIAADFTAVHINTIGGYNQTIIHT